MTAEPQSTIRTFGPLSVGAYTPIVTPYDCDYFEIIQTSDGSGMFRSSDGTDANGYQMVAGSWYALSLPSRFPSTYPRGKRFKAGSTVTYVRALVGTPSVVVEFIE